MNELIKKFERKCWDHQSNQLDADKFAEMIVKECAKIADDGYASDNFGNGITGHQLLEHFKVK